MSSSIKPTDIRIHHLCLVTIYTIIGVFSSPRVVHHHDIKHHRTSCATKEHNRNDIFLFSYTNNIAIAIDHILQLCYKANNRRLLPIGRRGCSFARCCHITKG